MAAPNAVHAQLSRLEETFSPEPQPPPFSAGVRLAIVVGLPLALWALVILAVGAVARALGA